MVGGKYRLERVLGTGAVGTVYGAVHQWTNREVAVKLLHEQVGDDAMTRQRFLREAQVAAGLKHPNVVDVLDMGDEDGKVYLVMEMLEGESLEARREREGKLSAGEALGLLLPVMDALERAHATGIVHRDLKPDNIFLHRGEGGLVPKVLDFGIAKRLAATDGLQTAVGTVLGTPQYMSPEQAAAESNVGPTSDIWSIGVVLFELLTGRPPFEGKTRAALMFAIVSGDAPPCASVDPSVPAEVGKAIDRALRNKADERYASMRELADALREAARRDGVQVKSLGSAGRALPSMRPGAAPVAGRANRVAVALAVAAAVAVLWRLFAG